MELDQKWGACLGVSETVQVLLQRSRLQNVPGALLRVSDTLQLSGAQDLVTVFGADGYRWIDWDMIMSIVCFGYETDSFKFTGG